MGKRRRGGTEQRPWARIAGWVVVVVSPVAIVGLGLHLVVSAAAGLVGASLPSVWAWLGTASSVDPDLLRLVLFGAIHVGLAVKLVPRGAALADHPRLRQVRRRWARSRLPARARRPVDGAIGLAGLFVAVALVLQPTLVPLRVDADAWVERAANLVDGTASASIVDSTVGLARAVYAPPVAQGAPVDPADLRRGLQDDWIPLMDRWDDLLLAAADGDRELVARAKAFMWVESGGRQFALSPTGCAGLMQFCTGTAQSRPFRAIFGAGRVAACGCRDCAVPSVVRDALETDPGAVEAHRDRFPCDLADARFDPERSIRAGVAYVRQLGERFDHQLPVMYVAYNSGPSVGAALVRRIRADEALSSRDRWFPPGLRRDLTVDDLRPHLAAALRPWYGDRADARARGLLDVHLPKLLAAHARWRP